MGMSNRVINYILALVLAVVATVGLSVGAVAAHHPIIEGSATRACGAEATWTATFQARADLDRNKQWRSQHSIDGGAPSSFSAWVDDAQKYGPFTIGPFAANKSAVTVKVSSEWRNTGGVISGTIVRDNRTITISRPNTTTCPTTTTSSTTSTTSSTTSTTVKETTTTQETTTTVQDTTTSSEATTTTAQATTTSEGATTTTAATPTTVDPGTTTTAVSTDTAPTTPPTGGTVVEPPNPPLPATGGVNPKYVWWGMFALGTGIFLIMITRRPTPRN